MRDRTFGIEIECGIGRNGTWDWDHAVDAVRTLHLEGKTEGDWTEGVHGDGTFMELDSPVLSGERGIREVHLVMATLREVGGYTGTSDGLHVHHGADDFLNDPASLVRLVRCWNHARPHLSRFVNRDRRSGGFRSHVCPPWADVHVQNLERAIELASSDPSGRGLGHWLYEVSVPRGDINLRSLGDHGTIEIRLHEGTLDGDKAEAWIRFGQAFLAYVRNLKTHPREIPSHEDLLRRLRVSSRATQVLLGAVA